MQKSPQARTIATLTVALLIHLTVSGAFAQSAYDGRQYQSAVRDQNPFGICWSFAATAVMEASLLKQGITSDKAWHFSTYDTAYWATVYYREESPDLNNPNADSWGGLNNNAYRLSWRAGGLVAESVTPYPASQLPLPVPDENATRSGFTAHDVFYTDLNGAAGLQITKDYIRQYGAVSLSFQFINESYDAATYSFYNTTTSTDDGHGVTLTGWNDDKVITVNGNTFTGAWLAKNSWSADWGDNGYFWISYDSNFTGDGDIEAAVARGGYQGKVYSYSLSKPDWAVLENDLPYSLIRYDHADSESLVAVGVNYYIENVREGIAFSTGEYELKIYSTYSGGALSDLLLTQSGTLHDGYNTLDLSALLELGEASDFYIWLYQTGGYLQVNEYDLGYSWYSMDGLTFSELTWKNTSCAWEINAIMDATFSEWAGGAGLWADEKNWSAHYTLQRVPVATDLVLIDGGDVTVSAGVGAVGKDIQVGIAAAGALTVSGTLTGESLTLGQTAAGAGTVTVSDSGRVTTTSTLTVGRQGAGSLILQDRATVAAGQLVIADEENATGQLVIVSPDARLTGADTDTPLTVSGGAGAGELVFDYSGSGAFANDVDGARLALTKRGDGHAALTGSVTHGGVTTIEAGTLEISSAFTGTGGVVNHGTLLLGGDGKVFTTGRLDNHGLVSFKNLGDTYYIDELTGDGAFRMDVDLVTGVADQLIISGDADGQHTLLLTNVGALPTGDEAPLTLVTVGGVNRAEFSGNLGVGLWNYGVNNTPGGMVLQRDGGVSALGAIVSGQPAAQAAAWFVQMDSLRQRFDALRMTEHFAATPALDTGHDSVAASLAFVGSAYAKSVVQPAAADAGVKQIAQTFLTNVWVRGYGGEQDVKKKVAGRAAEQTTYGTDLGGDLAWRLDADNHLHTGLFAGYGRGEVNYHADGHADTDNFYGGVYLAWLHRAGWFADAVLKGQHLSDKIHADNGGQTYDASYSNFGFGGELTGGRCFALDDGWFVQPQAGVDWLHLPGKNYRADDTVSVRASAADFVQFRGDVMLGRVVQTNRGILQLYLKLGVADTVSGGGKINGDLRANADGLTARAGTGLAWQLDASNQLHLDYEAAAGDKYTQPWSLSAGYLHQF
ncbi:MAG: autotransporter outer membrane beta-barrel domain-containing protein [Verrucomicrobiales bacterium]|nr:autotransporter outer membrane beta-barrel domain-containing protein [Verrucomicrobiales bacterium]